jgi:hypothetical protein
VKEEIKENSKKGQPAEVDEAFKGPGADAITLKLLGEHAEEKELVSAEKGESGEDLVMTGQPCPESQSPLGAAPQDDTFLQLGAEVQAQTQATMQARARATAQVEAASKAMTKLGMKQKSQVAAQDQNLVDTLKAAINQMEMKKNPALAVAAAKKKAVTNIQKALTKKILTRLDDTQPLVNVFSKMQSLSKMMPAIQDFERRLGILHQVEPILESAISTLSKVVDLSAPVPALPAAKPPQPAPPPSPPAPAPSSGPDLGAL